MAVKVKICGITSHDDMLMAADLGASYFGTVVEIDRSPRRLTREAAAEIHLDAPISGVALVQDRTAQEILDIARAIGPDVIQLQGSEPPELVRAIQPQLDCEIWKALHVPVKDARPVDLAALLAQAKAFIGAGVDRLLIDTIDVSDGVAKMGGTGKVGDWAAAAKLIEQIEVPVFLAGGLNPDNVAEAIRQVHPYGVDLASGVESAPGVKDPVKVQQLIQNAHDAG